MEKWKEELARNIVTAEELRECIHLSEEEYKIVKKEIEKYPMSISRYYASLIYSGANDPIRKMAVPGISNTEGLEDQSGEKSNTIMPGVQHKYQQTLLVLISTNCAMYCRHCFRRRFVGTQQEEIARDPNAVAEYIRKEPTINNVLLTGGDAFVVDTEVLRNWLMVLSELPQLDFIRIGTRTPVTFPARINLDDDLLSLFKEISGKKQLYIVTHFNHPNEFTNESITAIRKLQQCGVMVKNQTVLMKGINDNPMILCQLLETVTSLGMIQHYIFQCRPVIGVKNNFQIPIREGSRIVNMANAMQNGLGKSADYTMSHETGKIRILGEMNGEMVFQYKQAKDAENIGKIFTRKMDNETWIE